MTDLSGVAASHVYALPLRTWLKQPRIVRDLKGLEPVLARSGPLELRLATTKKDIRRAQRLRFQAFYAEGRAIPSRRNALSRRDKCAYDTICDHLLVIDSRLEDVASEGKSSVVGTYRLLRSDVAHASRGFYSRTEFNIDPMIDRHGDKRFLELGRSCVQADYRSKRVIDLLWRGIGLYAQHHRIDVLIGCASLPGTDPAALAAPLSYLYHHAAADCAWQVEPQRGRGARMDWMPKDTLDARQAIGSLPPLVKAYMRAGGRFASQAVVDHQFGTTDLFTILPFASADARYMAHFAAPGLIERGQPLAA